MGRRALEASIVVVVSLLLSPAVGTAQERVVQPAPTEGIALPDRSVTTQSDALSTEVNPAGLGFLNAAELRYGFDIDERRPEGEFDDQHGLFAAAGNEWFGAGFALQWLDRPAVGFESEHYRKFSFASALQPGGNWSFGLGLNFFGSRSSRRLNRLTSLDIGTQWRPSQFIGFGLALRETNHPFFRSDRGLPLRLEPGAALRLLGGSLVVDAQFEWVPAAETTIASPRLLVEPVRGVNVYGRVNTPLDSNDQPVAGEATTVTAGLEVSLGHVGIQSAATVRTNNSEDSGAFAGHAQQLWLTPQPRRSLLRPVGRWVKVDLTGGIAERATGGPFTSEKRSFLRLLLELRAMADDQSVEGVVFEIGNSGLGYGQVWELRQQIAHLRDSGTETVSYLVQPTFLESYLASASDRVLLLPAEPYDPAGMRVTTQYYAEALSRAGIEAEFVRIGRYKSAPESYVRRSPTKDSLEQTNAFIDDIYNEVVDRIAENRGVAPDAVERAVDEVPIYPSTATERGFADGIVYPDELRPHLEEEYGAAGLTESGYDPSPAPAHGWEGRPEVAVVYVDGSIIRGESTETPFVGRVLSGSETITATLEELGRDPNVRAIVLRVDSPGGSAVASDLIYRAVRRVAEEKPVVASMGDIAASGGYYVASGAETIYATPNTLTGSVGIFAGKFSVGELASWLGVNQHSIQRGERNGRFGLFTPWTEQQRKSVSKSIEYLYHLFLEQAAATRPLSPDQLDEVARGRVWSGTAAEKQKLVDKTGGLIEAIHAAEKKAGLEPGTARYESYPSPSPLIDVPFGGGVGARIAKWVRGSERQGRESALRSMLARLERSVRIPLVYEQGEPLMLPPKAIVISGDDR